MSAAAFIDKLAWVELQARRVLCVRSHGQDVFYLPGGKREAGESDAQCLLREIREELGVSLQAETLQPAGVFTAQAHGKPDGTLVRLTCYRGQGAGAPVPLAEIAELAWLSSADRARCSVVLVQVLDALMAQDLID